MPLLYCQNNVTRAGEFANCDVSRGLITADILPAAGRQGSGVHEGNEEKWFRPKEVQRRETRAPKAAPTPLKKTSIRAGKSAPENAYLYRGLFSRVRVVPALRAPGVSQLRGLHERETRRKG